MSRATRIALWAGVLAALLSFASGSNYCLIAALSGDAMACMEPPGSDTGRPSHCGHASDDPGGLPTSSPCCVTLAPAASTPWERPQLSTGFALFVPPVAIGTDRSALPAETPTAFESPPPGRDLPTALLQRGPPSIL